MHEIPHPACERTIPAIAPHEQNSRIPSSPEHARRLVALFPIDLSPPVSHVHWPIDISIGINAFGLSHSIASELNSIQYASHPVRRTTFTPQRWLRRWSWSGCIPCSRIFWAYPLGISSASANPGTMPPSYGCPDCCWTKLRRKKEETGREQNERKSNRTCVQRILFSRW